MADRGRPRTSERFTSEIPAWAPALASLCMIAHQVGGKSTRDALFFSTFHMRALSQIAVYSAVPVMLLAFFAPRVLLRFGPASAVSFAYVVSAMVHLLEWFLLIEGQTKPAAVLLFLHVLIVPVLTSGFWATLSEGEEVRGNRRRMTRAALAASAGGVVGGLLALGVGSTMGLAAMLPLLAALHLCCAFAVGRLRSLRPRPAQPIDHRVESTLYLSALAGFVFLLAGSAALVDFVFKGQVQAATQLAVEQIKIFSLFNMVTAVLALVCQYYLSPLALDRLKPARTAQLLPTGLILGSIGVLVAPGLSSAAIGRGSEMVLRNSFFRSGYEPLFNAVAAREKNASKTLVDVGSERLGDAVGYGLAWALLAFGGWLATRAQLGLAIGLAGAALLLANRIHHMYVGTLKGRGTNVPMPELPSGMWRDSEIIPALSGKFPESSAVSPLALEAQIAGLIGRDPAVIRSVLGSRESIRPELIPYVLPLLGSDSFARLALEALRRVVPASTGQLVDSLLSTEVDVAVRRRIPRVLVASHSERVVDGLMRGLEDEEFVVRLACGRALVQIRREHPEPPVLEAKVFKLVEREIAYGREVWEERRPLPLGDDEPDSPLVDDKLRKRANRYLEHVFDLLALVDSMDSMRDVFRALHTDDPQLRGDALEYLDWILPRPIRTSLWPYLEAEDRPTRRRPSKLAALSALRLAHDSVEISLSELQRLDGIAPGRRERAGAKPDERPPGVTEQSPPD